MPLKLRVPLEQVQAAVGGFLVLDHPPRCSRCGAQPAAEYETHKLRLRIGAKKPGLVPSDLRVQPGVLSEGQGVPAMLPG